MLLTAMCDTPRWARKEIFAFFAVIIAIVRLCSGSQNRTYTIQKESGGDPVYRLVTSVKKFHQKEDKLML